MKDLLHKDLKLPYNPWWFFPLFLFSNSLLTFGCFSPTLKIFIFVFGLGFPGLAAAYVCLPASSRQKPSFFSEPFKKFSIPVWVWILLVAGLFCTRFGLLTSSDLWIIPDDALIARYVLDLDQHWHLRALETVSQVSSLPTYLSWLVFKITRSMLVAAHFPGALFSLAAALVSFAAARLFFPKTVSFVFFVFFAFSYWPLFMAKPLLAASLLPLMELLVVYALGRWLYFKRSFWAFALGLAAGWGLYTFPCWPALWLWLVVLWVYIKARKSNLKFPLGPFSAGFLPALLPFVLTIWGQGYGGHLESVAAWNGFSFWPAQAQVIFNYVRILFWGGPSGLWTPLDGGFLNVFFASFFFLGALELFRHHRPSVAFFLALALPLFLLPGFLSHNVETCRVLLILPVLLIVASIGLCSLLMEVPDIRRAAVLTLALILACGWDIFRICHSVQAMALSGGAPAFNERQLSYEVLKPIAGQQGPGLLFSEMVPFTTDNSLLVASYPFNAALNPRLDPKKAVWAAVFTDWDYVPSLRKRFPFSRWIEWTPRPGSIRGRHYLGVIPLTPDNRAIFESWRNYYLAVQKIDFEYIDTPTGHPETQVLQDLLRFYGSVPNDPFLQSCYFEKLVYYYSFEKTFYPQDTQADWQNFGQVFTQSFGKSLQDTVLCEKFGRILEISNRPAPAGKMFEKALRLNPKNQALRDDLKQVSNPKT